MESPDEQRAMLRQLIERAERLLGELVTQQEELQRDPAKLPPGDLAEGRRALENAIESAGRMMTALRDAEMLADEPTETD